MERKKYMECGQTKDYCWDEFCIFPPVKGLKPFF